MNDQTPYPSRRELRRREAEAEAQSTGGAHPVESRDLPTPGTSGPGFSVADTFLAALDQGSQMTPRRRARLVDPEAPAAVSHTSSAPGTSAPKSTDPDCSVKASNMTRARMARAVERGEPSGAGRRQRRGAPAAQVRQTSIRRGRKMVPFLAVFFVGGLALVTALPANADLQTATDTSSFSSRSGLVQDGAASAAYVQGQQIEASNAQASTSRDGVSATNLRTNFGGRTSATYVNNPNGIIQWPFSVTVPISDLFGWRVPPCAWCSADHKGVDFDAGEGYPIQAVADGVVTKVHAADDNGDGMYVEITHDVDGLKFMSRYCHLLEGSILVQEGQVVKVTDIIAQVGNTGASTGAHLHFEIHVNGVAVDPFAWLMEHAK